MRFGTDPRAACSRTGTRSRGRAPRKHTPGAGIPSSGAKILSTLVPHEVRIRVLLWPVVPPALTERAGHRSAIGSSAEKGVLHDDSYQLGSRSSGDNLRPCPRGWHRGAPGDERVNAFSLYLRALQRCRRDGGGLKFPQVPESQLRQPPRNRDLHGGSARDQLRRLERRLHPDCLPMR